MKAAPRSSSTPAAPPAAGDAPGHQQPWHSRGRFGDPRLCPGCSPRRVQGDPGWPCRGDTRSLTGHVGAFPVCGFFSRLGKCPDTVQGGGGTSSHPRGQGTRGGRAPRDSWGDQPPQAGDPRDTGPSTPGARTAGIPSPGLPGGRAGGDRPGGQTDNRTDSVPAFGLRVGEANTSGARGGRGTERNMGGQPGHSGTSNTRYPELPGPPTQPRHPRWLLAGLTQPVRRWELLSHPQNSSGCPRKERRCNYRG